MSEYRNENNNENEKYCPNCETVKPRDYEHWHKHSKRPDGLYAWCKVCINEKNRTKKEYRKLWRKENPDKVRAHNEKQKKNMEKWRKENPDYSKDWYHKNKNKINSKRAQRRIDDPCYKLRSNVSTMIWLALKREGGSKNGESIFEHLPYTIDQMREHLESQFDDNMAWDNYGSYWHVDHIYPQSLLPYQSFQDENFKKCWALENLQPLEGIENIRKSNKIQ